LNKINHIKKQIYEGEFYECCYTHKIFLDNINHHYDLYLKLREENSAPFSAYISIGSLKIISCSPERFLKLDHKEIEMRPIKGTIKRGNNYKEDIKLEKMLRNSTKNQAENIMIVDLIRNDLGRVCNFSSIKVKELFKIEKYASLFQMVSTISGVLKKNKDIFDLLMATFPGGSMTGAPKIRAMMHIDKLEKFSRGIYSGSIGWIDTKGNTDLSIIIRTIISDTKTKKGYIQVGGAIVKDSNPLAEYDESLLKGEKILQII
jgi:para-aminobenzoate synthetase component I